MNESKGNNADVIIIGGGPAGSTAASVLAMHGRDVLLLEKEKFPREHVGESLLPYCYPVFQELGVLDEMIDRFVRKPGARFIAKDSRTYTNWCFEHVIKDESYLSFHVVRAEFDEVLLQNSRKKGARVLEETRVKDVDLSNDQEVVVRAADKEGKETEYRARFLLDASGRSSFVSTRNGTRKPHPGLERTAIWSHWKGVKELKGGLEDGMTVIMYIGGEKRGWCWLFTLAPDWLTIGAVLNNESFQAGKNRFAKEGAGDWKTELYKHEIFESDFIRDLLDGAEMTMPPIVEGDYSYYSEQKFGANFALLGDANRFVDPIFSSGVYLAMKGSSLAGHAVDAYLSNPEDASPLKAAYEQINGACDCVHELVRLYYNPHAVNFAEAGHVLQPENHADALSAGHYILAGDFFESHKKYKEFFKLLSDKEYLFKGYKNLVLERPNLNAQSCDERRPETIFPPRQSSMISSGTQ